MSKHIAKAFLKLIAKNFLKFSKSTFYYHLYLHLIFYIHLLNILLYMTYRLYNFKNALKY